jgi:hypothetical protein
MRVLLSSSLDLIVILVKMFLNFRFMVIPFNLKGLRSILLIVLVITMLFLVNLLIELIKIKN